MFKKLNLYIFLLFFLITVSASNDEKNSLIEIYDNPNDINLINIVIKDNIDIGGKVTSAGSLALKDNIAKSDAFIIDKLKRANYYILGKANLSEWANFRSEDSVSGWSSLGGQTKHYLDDTYNPCGSSSGSAVAVSMGIVDIAIGTETNGSISCPSSVNGIVGMKPTTGLVSRSGIVPISSSQDTAGPMGASVDIVAKTLEVISGYDENDPATSLIPSNFDFNFSSATKNISLKGVRLGLLDSENSNPQVIKLHKKIKEIINSLGGEIILINDDRDYPDDAEYYVLLYEFRVGLEEYLKNTNSSMKKITDIIDFNNANKDIVMPYFGQDIFYKSIESTSYLKYLWSKYKLNKSYKSTKDLLDKYDLNAFIGLTRGPAWKINYDGGDYVAMNDSPQFGSGGYAAHNGMPHITIPYFEINKFPVGISIIGDRWSDKAIIEYASAIEKSRYN
jgi:amidase|tara:strand:- start:121 stop:1467 length:1347 start_codon:yes stop_codon:yes gene_type:complete